MYKENKEKSQRNTRFTMQQDGFKRNSNFRFFKRKSCRFCDSGKNPSFRDFEFLKKFTTEQGKILPKRITGTCSKHQRSLALEIKRARYMALLAFIKKG